MEIAAIDDASEEDFDYRDRVIVCRHLLRRQKLFDQTWEVVKEVGYFNKYPMLQVLFNSALSTMPLHGLPLLEMIQGDVIAAKTNGIIDEVDFRDAKHLLDKWFAPGQEYTDAFVLDILRDARTVHIEGQVQERQEEGDDIAEIVRDAKHSFDVDPFSRAAEQNPFFAPEEYLGYTERYPMGIGFIDDALNGGAQIGEFIGLVAPSGGGKTTAALQICGAQVEQKQHVVYFQTEQGMEGDIALRSYVLATKIPRAIWEKGWDKAPDDAKEKFFEFGKLWKEYWHPFALRDNMPKSIDELFTYVEDLAAEGKAPRYIVIDWWGDIRDALMEYYSSKSETAARRASRTWLKQIKTKAAADHCNCIPVVFQQLSGEASAKSAKRVQSSHSAQEDRNFNNRMDFCFTFGSKDSNDRLQIRCDKARRFSNLLCTVELDGKLCLLRQINDPDSSAEALTEEEDLDLEDLPATINGVNTEAYEQDDEFD